MRESYSNGTSICRYGPYKKHKNYSMKPLPTLLAVTLATHGFAATTLPVTDPAQVERCHASLQEFNPSKGRYVTAKGSWLLLDGNETSGVQYSAGRQQFLISLPKAESIQRINLVGTGAARFTVSVSNDNSVPGDTWAVVLKNVPLNHQWGADRPVNRTARYILVETDAPASFMLNEFAVYGERLAPITSSGRRYLSDFWGTPSPAPETPQPVGAGPSSSSGYNPGKLGFPPRITNGGGMTNTLRPITIPAPRGRIGAPPTIAR